MYSCEKCNYQTDSKKLFNNHLFNKNSCNEEYDNQILKLASDKIKSLDNLEINFEITYNDNDYVLYIKKSSFEDPDFGDFYVRYDKPNALHVGFFAELNKDGELCKKGACIIGAMG